MTCPGSGMWCVKIENWGVSIGALYEILENDFCDNVAKIDKVCWTYYSGQKYDIAHCEKIPERESRLWGLWIGSCDCIRSEDRMWTLAGQPQKAPPCHPCMYTYVQYLAHWVQFASWWHCRFYSALQCRRTLAIAGQRQKVSTPLLPPHIIQDVNMYKLYAYMMSARKGKFSWEEVMCASITWEHSVRRSDSTSMQLHTLLLMNFHLLFLNAIFKSNGNQHKLYMRTVLDEGIEHLSTGALFFHRLFLNVMFQEHWKSAQF